jgi:hypothetical protein
MIKLRWMRSEPEGLTLEAVHKEEDLTCVVFEVPIVAVKSYDVGTTSYWLLA